MSPTRWPKILREDGIEVLLETHADARRGPRRASFDVDGQARPAASARVTARTCWSPPGRTPNTETLNLRRGGRARPTKAASSPSTSGWRRTCQASTRWATSRAARPSPTSPTTTSASCARICCEGGARTTDDRLVPYTVFIDPQLGRVGLSEEEARAAGAEHQGGEDADELRRPRRWRWTRRAAS